MILRPVERGERQTLLLVDDAPANLKVLIEGLEEDYEIIIATNGERALHWAASANPPDLILLDILMPEMDGYAVCQRLKVDARTRDIPVIFVTAVTAEEDEAKGLAMGAVDYIHKPYSLSIIRTRIATHLALKAERDKLAQARLELLEANAGLEERVAERTADLIASNNQLMVEILEHKKTTDALAQASIAASQASKAKRQFLDNMGHEIRTPINGIMGFSSLLEGARLPGRQQVYVEMLTASAKRLLDTVDKVLDFARIESENMDFTSRVFTVADLLKVVIDEVQGRIKAKKLRLCSDLDGALPARVVGDPHRLQQVLVNLLDNAVKFSRQGEIVLGARVTGYSEGGVVLHLRVEDQGEGIAGDEQEKIFRAFNQVDTSNTRRYDGTGLGLTIAALLVQMMGGKIWVESTLGAGSIFHVTVGLGIADDNDTGHDPWPMFPAPMIAASMVSDRQGHRSPARILLVEDEEISQVFLNDILKEQGWQVEVASNGREAVEACRQGGFDLVLMDIQMPEMTGLDAATIIRRFEKKQGRHTPIIAVTGHALASDRQKCLASGMDDYLTKPIKLPLLFQAIHRQLHQKSST